MINQLRKLRLREGDIIVVRDNETMKALVRLGKVEGIPPCPIVVSPGSIYRLSADYLKRLIANKEA